MPAAAGASDTYAGTVINGTTGKPVPRMRVSLTPARAGKALPAVRTTTGSDGRFRFEGLSAGQDTTYRASATYQDVVYSTVAGPLAQDARLMVYDATPSDAAVRIRDWVVWLDRDQGIAVQHDVEVVNDGKRTFAGSQQIGSLGKAVLAIPLAPGAKNLQYLDAFEECCAAVAANTLVHTHPLSPGTTRGTVRFVTSALPVMSFNVPLPTDRFSVLVAAGLKLSAPSLEKTGEMQDRGVTYQVYVTTGLEKGASVALSVAEPTRRGTPRWIGLLVGVALLGAAVFVVVRGRADRAPKKAKQAAPPVVAPPAVVTHSAAVAAPAEEAELLLDEIAALDLAAERGLLDPAVHERIRTIRRARLIELRAASIDDRTNTP